MSTVDEDKKFHLQVDHLKDREIEKNVRVRHNDGTLISMLRGCDGIALAQVLVSWRALVLLLLGFHIVNDRFLCRW